MRAFAVKASGDPPSLQDLPVPADDASFLIRVVCAGVNPIDYKLLDRLTAESRFPFVMGIDFAGVIERTPASESTLRRGDRVFGMARTHGAYAEFTAVAAGTTTEPIARIPDGVSDEEAAALPIPGITALRSMDLLDVCPGRTLVVIGANGGVGGYAVQLARARDAHVIAVVRSDVDEARRLGAHEVHVASTTAVDDVRAANGDGVDAVLDIVNGPTAIRRDAEMLKSGGRLVSAVYAADEAWFAEQGITAHNIASNTNPLSSPTGLEELARLVERRVITPRIRGVFPIEETNAAIAALRNGGVRGKVIIRPS